MLIAECLLNGGITLLSRSGYPILETTYTTRDPIPSSGITLRAFAVGSLFALFVGVGAPFSNMVIQGSWMALDFSTPGALFLFFILTAIINSVLRVLGPGFALSRSELIVVYIMMITASSLATMGFIEYLLPIITGWLYYATPENRWI